LDINKPVIRNRTKEVLETVNRPEDFIRNLQELLRAYADEEATKNYQRIIPETGKFHGVPKPILRLIAAEIGQFIQRKPTDALALLQIIWGEGSFEAKQIAGMSLEKFGSKYTSTCLNFISSALPDLDNWSVCDILAMSGVRPIVYSAPELILPLSERWIRSNNKWTRRFGVVSLLGYKRVKTTTRVFALLDSVMEDNEQDIKKAVSWVLRDISKKNPEEVAEFLIRWAKAKPSKTARWIIKDGLTKLPKDTQNALLTLIG
jgi:3-methyladenine DNA glycosylase AlkD